MRHFIVRVEWAGYSRGQSTYRVEAESPQEAQTIYHEGTRTQHKVIRDDTEVGRVLSIMPDTSPPTATIPQILTEGKRKTMLVTLMEELQETIHITAVSKGWWEQSRETGTLLALIHSEISEALEADRKNAVDDKIPQYSGLEAELADAIIRILDMAEGLELRVIEAMMAKIEFNKTRTHKHGGKRF